MDFSISREGLIKNGDKQKAIIEAPRPTSVTQNKSFAGMVNYYSRFLPKLSIILRPIYDLLKINNKFARSDSCEQGTLQGF